MQRRTNVPTEVKQRLVEEAGGKCANPGCPTARTHLHHIAEWAVYQTHDEERMIALCPTCHDAVHHGDLEIDDATVYRWRAIPRLQTKRDHIYVEPAKAPKLLLGTIAVTGTGGVTVFELGDTNRLSFRIADEDVLLMNLAVSTTRGDEVLRVVDGHVRHEAVDPVRYERVAGHVRVTAPVSHEFIPDWAIERMRRLETGFGATGSLPILDIEVLEPGLVRVQGVWNASSKDAVIVITLTAGFHPAGDSPTHGDGWRGSRQRSAFRRPNHGCAVRIRSEARRKQSEDSRRTSTTARPK